MRLRSGIKEVGFILILGVVRLQLFLGPPSQYEVDLAVLSLAAQFIGDGVQLSLLLVSLDLLILEPRILFKLAPPALLLSTHPPVEVLV